MLQAAAMATGENLTGHWSPRDKESRFPALCAKSQSLISPSFDLPEGGFFPGPRPDCRMLSGL
jgi:hypothetical protein